MKRPVLASLAAQLGAVRRSGAANSFAELCQSLPAVRSPIASPPEVWSTLARICTT